MGVSFFRLVPFTSTASGPESHHPRQHGATYRNRNAGADNHMSPNSTTENVLSESDRVLLEKEALTLAQAARLVPSRNGKPIYVNTVWRWCMKGLRQGIRLKSVLIGGHRYTTRTWLYDFVQKLSAVAAPQPETVVLTHNQRQRAAEEATRELTARWSNKK